MSVDPNQLLASLQGSPGGGPTSQPPGGVPADPQSQQIVWNVFPSTDPAQVGQLLSQGLTPDVLGQLMQLQETDQDQMHQLQVQAIQAHVQAATSPAPAQGAPPPQGGGPGVGGGMGG